MLAMLVMMVMLIMLIKLIMLIMLIMLVGRMVVNRPRYPSLERFVNGIQPSQPPLQIIILTRFSILDYNATNWKLSRNNHKHHMKAALFHPRRLSEKFEAFERITFPSVMNQTYKNFTWLIHTSSQLPLQWKQRLERIIASSPASQRIQLSYVDSVRDSEGRMTKYINAVQTDYFSMRLDDDDGLNERFFENLQKYQHHPTNTIVSHPRGHRITLRNGKVVVGSKHYEKNIALGLAIKNDNIFNSRHHHHVYKTRTVIYDDLDDAFFVFCSPYTDTSWRFY